MKKKNSQDLIYKSGLWYNTFMSDKKFCCADKFNMYEMCNNCYNAFFTDPEFQVQFYENYENEPRVTSSMSFEVCECGSEASGGTTHSDWCPKFTRNRK